MTKKIKQPMSLREQLLIAVLVLSALIGSYIMLRVQVQTAQKMVWQEQLDSSRSAKKSARTHRATNNDSKKLAQEIVKLEQDIAQTITTVSGIEGRFIDLKSKKSVANMRSRLTDLAQRNNLRLSKVTKSQQDLAKFTSANQKKLAAFLERPMFNIELSGSYHDLLDFIKQLDSLPNRVVVTHFSLEEQISLFVKAGQAKPLAIKLTLSF
jgi:Tfp pilus assembly protein PilO